MKLFVWCEPYDVSYGTSMFYAVAETVEEAKALAVGAPNYAFGRYKQDGTPKVELGEPTRVLDLPCAEWVYWEE